MRGTTACLRGVTTSGSGTTAHRARLVGGLG